MPRLDRVKPVTIKMHAQSPLVFVHSSQFIYIFLDQELISYCYSSCSSCCWGNLSKKPKGLVSNQMLMKFLLVNSHRLTESVSRSDVISGWRPRRDFMQKSAAVWWLHAQCLPSSYAVSEQVNRNCPPQEHNFTTFTPYPHILDINTQLWSFVQYRKIDRYSLPQKCQNFNYSFNRMCLVDHTTIFKCSRELQKSLTDGRVLLSWDWHANQSINQSEFFNVAKIAIAIMKSMVT